MVLKMTVLFVAPLYILLPQILLTNWISFNIMVTHLAYLAYKFGSSINKTRYASAASIPPCYMSCTNSLTKQLNGILLISSSVDLWHFLISRNAMVPGQYFLGLSVLGSLPPFHLAFALAAAAT